MACHSMIYIKNKPTDVFYEVYKDRETVFVTLRDRESLMYISIAIKFHVC